nr:hypothetical protein [Pleurocapsa sp. PCC 7327]
MPSEPLTDAGGAANDIPRGTMKMTMAVCNTIWCAASTSVPRMPIR